MARSKIALAALLGLSVLVAATAGAAIEWPARPVSIVVGATPGGGQDAAARLYGKYLQKYLGKPFPVVNMAGGGNTIASENVRSAQPDGYTMLLINENILSNKIAGTSEYAHEAFAFGGIGLVSKSVGMFSLTEKYKTFDEVIAAAKANPDTVINGTEIGTTTHQQIKAMEKQLGIQFQVVDVGTVGARLSALLGGHIDLAIMPLGNCKDYVATGDFTPLVMLNDDRVEKYKDYPIITDFGANVVSVKFFALFLPKDTDAEIVATLRNTVQKITQDPDFIKEAEAMDYVIQYHDAREYLDKAYTVMANY